MKVVCVQAHRNHDVETPNMLHMQQIANMGQDVRSKINENINKFIQI